MCYLQYELVSTNHSGKLVYKLRTNTTEPLPPTTCTLQTTYWRQQQDRQTIDKPITFTNNRPTDIWLTKDRSKCTNHVLQSPQPITSQLNWQMTNNIATLLKNQNNDQTLKPSTDNLQFTWLSWWLLLRLSKRQSMSSQAVLLRTTITRILILYQLMIWLLGSNH